MGRDTEKVPQQRGGPRGFLLGTLGLGTGGSAEPTRAQGCTATPRAWVFFAGWGSRASSVKNITNDILGLC